MLNNPMEIINRIMSNPQFANNPRAKSVMDALQKNDHDALVQIGENIFRENGSSLEEATNKFMRNRRFN